MAKERYQNPVLGDDLTLRLFTYNSHNRADISEVESVNIYFLDPENKTDGNPDGRRLMQTILSSAITREEIGQYSFQIHLEQSEYVIGQWIDEWNIFMEEYQPVTTVIDNSFIIYPDLWYTNTSPIFYDFSFTFEPNKLRKGSKRFLIVSVTPNVPSATDLQRYYENLAIVSNICIYIELECGECMPVEQEMRMIVDGDTICYREMCRGYYLLDTTDLNCGVYNVWFEMAFGEQTYVSDKQQLQIF